MSAFFTGLVLVLIGSVIGAVATLYFVIKGDVRDGDRPNPPYDEEGWK